MRQFLIGAAFGAVSAVVVALLVQQRSGPEVGSVSAGPVSIVSSSPLAGGPDGINPLAEAARDNNLSQTPPNAALSSVGSSTKSGQVSNTPPSSTAKAIAAAESIPSVMLSAEHAKLLSPQLPEDRTPTLQELHMQFSTERDDQSWAITLEQNINSFLAQNNSSGEFEILTVDCRSTLCEILAFGNLPNSPQRWSALGSEMRNQPWWSNFKGNSTSSAETNGRTTIVTILQRVKK